MWGAKLGTLDGYRLYAFATLIATYDEENFILANLKPFDAAVFLTTRESIIDFLAESAAYQDTASRIAHRALQHCNERYAERVLEALPRIVELRSRECEIAARALNTLAGQDGCNGKP